MTPATVNAQELQLGDRIGSARWTIESLIVRPRASREHPGAVIAAGTSDRNERFALNCKPHRPVQVWR